MNKKEIERLDKYFVRIKKYIYRSEEMKDLYYIESWVDTIQNEINRKIKRKELELGWREEEDEESK